MAILIIDDHHRIASDELQWMLQKRTGIDKKTGLPAWKNLCYHSDLGALVREFAERRIRSSEAEGLAEILAEIEIVCRTLTDALKPIVKINLKAIEGRK